MSEAYFLGSLLRMGAQRLVARCGADAPLEAEVLLRHLLNWSRTELYSHLEAKVPESLTVELARLLDRRAAGYPLQYLTGHQEFMSLDFLVDERVLVPRPETEVLVEAVLDLAIPGRGDLVDVGCGSGCLALSLSHYLPWARVWALDTSAAALEVCALNTTRLGLAGRVVLRQGDLLMPLLQETPRPVVQVVVANLPYVASSQLASLPDEVQAEPVLALDGGLDGLDLYRRLLPQAATLVVPGGLVVLECADDQAVTLTDLVAQAGFTGVKVRRDLAGRQRTVMARWPGEGA